MSGKPEEHHHTCSEAEDHHCPECCPCKCCSRHSRTYETHRRYSSHPPVGWPGRPLYPWDEEYKDAEEWRRWMKVNKQAASSPSDLNQAREASLLDYYKQRRIGKGFRPIASSRILREVNHAPVPHQPLSPPQQLLSLPSPPKDQPSNVDIDSADRDQLKRWVYHYRTTESDIQLGEESDVLREWLKTKLSGADAQNVGEIRLHREDQQQQQQQPQAGGYGLMIDLMLRQQQEQQPQAGGYGQQEPAQEEQAYDDEYHPPTPTPTHGGRRESCVMRGKPV